MTSQKIEVTDKRNGHRFKVEIHETENRLIVNFKIGGWIFTSVDFDKASFTSSCTTKNRNGSNNLWMVNTLFGSKENLIEYARILIA